MSDKEFIDAVYEIAFGDNARYRLKNEQCGYEHQEVLETIREFSDKALEHDEPQSENSKKEVEDIVLKLTSNKMKRYQKTATNADELIGFIMDDDGKIDGSYIIDQLVEYGLNFQVECVLIFDCDNMENVIHLGRTTNLTVKFLCDATKRHNAVKDYVKFYGNPTHIAEVDYDVRNADYEFFISEGQIKKWGKGEY